MESQGEKKNEQRRRLHVAWAITGAGHHLHETLEVLRHLRDTGRVDVTLLFSKAALEVTRMYGLLGSLLATASVPRRRHVVREPDQGSSFPICGKFNLDLYDALVVCPATANTVAKVAAGVADTLVTNVVAMASKGPPQVFLVPTDYEAGPLETTLPVTADFSKCEGCPVAPTPTQLRRRPEARRSKVAEEDEEENQREVGEEEACPIVDVCPHGAISWVEGKGFLDLRNCHGCMKCVRACPAVFQYGKKITITIRDLDAENVRRLVLVEDIVVLPTPRDILSEIEAMLASGDGE